MRGMGWHLAVGCLAQRASRPSRGPRAPPPRLDDGGPDERDRHREADRVDCVRIVHLTETCDEGRSHLITHAQTMAAPVADGEATTPAHTALRDKGLLPATHLVDTGYLDAELLVATRRDFEIDLAGPARADERWQAREGKGFAAADFSVDWERKEATCAWRQSGWFRVASPNDVPNRAWFCLTGCSHCLTDALPMPRLKRSRLRRVRRTPLSGTALGATP